MFKYQKSFQFNFLVVRDELVWCIVHQHHQLITLVDDGGSVAPGSGHAKSITTLRSNAKDGYTVNFLSEQGIMLRFPNSSGELICDAE